MNSPFAGLPVWCLPWPVLLRLRCSSNAPFRIYFGMKARSCAEDHVIWGPWLLPPPPEISRKLKCRDLRVCNGREKDPMEGTVFTPSWEGMELVIYENGEMLTMPFLDACKLVLPVVGSNEAYTR